MYLEQISDIQAFSPHMPSCISNRKRLFSNINTIPEVTLIPSYGQMRYGSAYQVSVSLMKKGTSALSVCDYWGRGWAALPAGFDPVPSHVKSPVRILSSESSIGFLFVDLYILFI